MSPLSTGGFCEFRCHEAAERDLTTPAKSGRSPTAACAHTLLGLFDTCPRGRSMARMLPSRGQVLNKKESAARVAVSVDAMAIARVPRRGDGELDRHPTPQRGGCRMMFSQSRGWPI